MEDSPSNSPTKKQNHTFYSSDDSDFLKTHAHLLFRTTGQAIGSGKTMITPETKNGLNGKFTNHLAAATMYRNRSLNTTVETDRFLNGCRDWELKLG